MNRSPARRAQMELMGLAIVVMLLALAFIFVVKFVILKDPADQTSAYRESELAASFISTMLATNARDCTQPTYSTLIADCASGYSDGGRIECNQQRSCAYMSDRLDDVFTATFDTWRVPYFFTVFTNLDDPENTQLVDLSKGSPCTGDRRFKTQPLPLSSGSTVYLGLYICDNDVR